MDVVGAVPGDGLFDRDGVGSGDIAKGTDELARIDLERFFEFVGHLNHFAGSRDEQASQAELVFGHDGILGRQAGFFEE